MKAVFVIPVYNHGSTLETVVQGLLQYKIPVIVVDDGNNQEQKMLIACVAQNHPQDVILVTRKKNGGKGRAMNDGVRKAAELGFSHVFQVDADGQHDVSVCSLFLQEAEKTPEDIICGYPLYDESVPESRKKGREFSNAWARFVTMNRDIKDVLCGFRVYPVAPYMELLDRHAVINSHMGYDTDILVHLSWKGLKIRSFGVPVTYPADGISNFRMVRDNIHISLTYARLCAGMIVRLPMLIARKSESPLENLHWSKQKEVVKTNRPIKFLVFLVKIIPFPVLSFFTIFVSFFYYTVSKQARLYCRLYQNQLFSFTGQKHRRVNTFAQIYSFSLTIVEKISAWSEKIHLRSIEFQDDDVSDLKKVLGEGKGAYIFTSHLGNTELLRCLATLNETGVNRNIPVTAVMDIGASQFNKTLKEINPNSAVHLVNSSEIGIETIELLQNSVNAGGLVVIGADRTSPDSPERTLSCEFLGKKALYPYGSFLLAFLLEAPVYFVFALRKKTFMLRPKYAMYVQKAKTLLSSGRKDRALKIEELCSEFVKILQKLCILYPYQWYNFYNYWQ